MSFLVVFGGQRVTLLMLLHLPCGGIQGWIGLQLSALCSSLLTGAGVRALYRSALVR